MAEKVPRVFLHLNTHRSRPYYNIYPYKRTVKQFSSLFVLRFYGPVNINGSCRARAFCLITLLLGRLSPLCGWPVLRNFYRQKLTTARLESVEENGRRKDFNLHKRMFSTRRGSNPKPPDHQLHAQIKACQWHQRGSENKPWLTVVYKAQTKEKQENQLLLAQQGVHSARQDPLNTTIRPRMRQNIN